MTTKAIEQLSNKSWNTHYLLVDSPSIWKNQEYFLSEHLKSKKNADSTIFKVCVDQDTVYIFSKRLQDIAIQIEDAKEILDNDADCINSPNKQTFIKACGFLHNYSVFIDKNYSTVIKTPYFDSLNDGSVYLNWDLPNSKLTIIFKSDNNPIAYFYGERKDRSGNIIPFKSAVEIDGDVDEIFAQWMKTYLI